MKRVEVLSFIFLATILAACGGGATANTPGATVVSNTAAVVPTAIPAASGDMATAIARANATQGSPCVGAQPVAGENIQPNGGGKWTAPAQVIDATHTYCAIFTTTNGRIVAELFSRIAPQNVNNFVFLAKQGYYENITWHRVIQGFMAQSGDPTGTGAGGPGYGNIPLEMNPAVTYDRPGRLGVARTNDPNSAGSQFFITFAPQSALDPGPNGPGYTIMGQVVEGLNVVNQIKIRNVDQNPNLPKGDTLISVRVVDLGAAGAAPSAPATAAATLAEPSQATAQATQ
ncbi:MAG TPA: peptidylprolyl isomerase [Aggregatilineales bacterium]|nr:peptidylprolyl isomerase [Aggregatilineales bacterium]